MGPDLLLYELAGTDECFSSLSLHSLTIKREATPLRSWCCHENQISDLHSVRYVIAAQFVPRVHSRGDGFVKQALTWVQNTWVPVFSSI